MRVDRFLEKVSIVTEDSESGLDSTEVQRRISVYGYNEVRERKSSFSKKIALKFWGIVPWMLEATSIITVVLGKYLEALVILALLFFNSGLSLWREKKANNAITNLKTKLSIQSRVRRDGKWVLVSARELVPADLVRVRIGDILPADVKLIDGNLGVDQSMLTGESGTVIKSEGETAYSGSTVKFGEASGVVTATGTKTYFGKTVSLLQMAKPKLHIEEVTIKVARRLAVIVLAALIITFSYALFTGFQLTLLLPLVGVLVIASVPVAMPTMFTINMAIGSAALTKEGVLVTRLSASEDAAVMDVLCLDKTGTITSNELHIKELIPLNGFTQTDVLLYGALASKEANQDPIDLAFLAAATEAHLPLDTFTQKKFMPFDPKTRITAATIEKDGDVFFIQKGALDKICTACDLSEQESKDLFKLTDLLSARGLRTIAVVKGTSLKDLKFAGFVGIADSIREDSRKAIEEIEKLGVKVKMLTGDSLPIASNVATQVGLTGDIVLMPKIIEGRSQKKSVDSLIEKCSGVAQIYPEDKFMIVKTLQRMGHVVGMTGDGVNDAPALAQAEVGIAVKNAADIAKDSASAVLTVEGLCAIKTMIKISRTIYQRLYSWTFTMISWKLLIMGFLILMLFFLHSLMLSITSTVILLFLGDFVSMSISSDNVSGSARPNTFSVPYLFRVSGTLGILMTIESAVFTVIAIPYFGLIGNVGKIYTFGFAYLALSGVFTLMIARQPQNFWKSRPSRILALTVLAEVSLVLAISVFGVLELAPLGYLPVLAIVTYLLVMTFLLNDTIKVYFNRKLKAN
jgi:H+-transporting ATPase